MMRLSQASRILIALAAGLGLGILGAQVMQANALAAADVLQPVGGAWLNGLRMTIVPLIVALVVTGIAASAAAVRAGRVTARAVVLIAVMLLASAVFAALVTPALLSLFPMPGEAARALTRALASAEAIRPPPPFSEFVASIIPTNPVAAAAEDAILPLIVFTTVFAFAVLRLPDRQRLTLIGLFEAVQDAMLIVIGWVLLLAPIGVFALAFVVGARSGAAAFGALVHYILVVAAVGAMFGLIAYPLAVFGGRVRFLDYVRAVAPAQAVAISTQSSLASLPAMLRGAEKLAIPVRISGVVLPLAVAIFRSTGPCMNLAVAIYVAHWVGIELTPWQLTLGVAAAAMTTLGAVSLPGTLTFVTSIAPICIAMGVPIAPLALLIAVETLPDLVRTLGNVMMDVSVTATVAARSGEIGETDGIGDALLRADGPPPPG